MTKKEMTEIFAVMMLAYPNAEMFKGGIQKLKPTIELWVSCLPEIDFWTGQQALVRLCRECKYPPTIAEFKEKADAVQKDMESRFDHHIWYIRSASQMYDSLEAFYASIHDPELRMAIDRIGGPGRLTKKLDNGDELYNWEELRPAFFTVIRQGAALPSGSRKTLPSPDG